MQKIREFFDNDYAIAALLLFYILPILSVFGYMSLYAEYNICETFTTAVLQFALITGYLYTCTKVKILELGNFSGIYVKVLLAIAVAAFMQFVGFTIVTGALTGIVGAIAIEVFCWLILGICELFSSILL